MNYRSENIAIKHENQKQRELHPETLRFATLSRWMIHVQDLPPLSS